MRKYELDKKDNEIIELKKCIGILERIIIDQQKIYINNSESIEISDEERLKKILDNNYRYYIEIQKRLKKDQNT